MSTEPVVFQVGNSPAVQLADDCTLPRGMRIREHREGKSTVLEPIADEWSPAFLGAAGAWTEGISRPGQDEQPRDPLA